MKYRILTASALVCLALGCNQNPSQPVSESSTSQPAPTSPVTLQANASRFESPAVTTPPADIVSVFVTAVRDGDDKTTSALLTDTARQATAERNLTVAPPGAPSAQFKVGHVEYIGPQQTGAHVTCTWSEDDGQGHRITYDVVWVLRRQPDGWRIAGLAADHTPGQPPVFLNFEDPDDMIEKQRWAEQIAADYEQNQPIQQARQPQPNSNQLR